MRCEAGPQIKRSKVPRRCASVCGGESVRNTYFQSDMMSVDSREIDLKRKNHCQTNEKMNSKAVKNH